MVMHLGPAEVTTPGDGVVRVSRAFNAPRELVYRAFTEPDLVRKWLLGPPGWSMPVCEMDVRPGGRFVWRWRSDDDGSQFGFTGEFREVEAPARFVHTEVYEPGDVGGEMGGEAIVTVTLVEEGGVTTVATEIDYGSNEARDAVMATGMTSGMEASYRNLDELLVGSD